MTTLLPFCQAVGCGNRVKRLYRRYGGQRIPTRFCSTACIPASLRAETCRKNRKRSAYLSRRTKFLGLITQLGHGPITREDLLASYASVWRMGYGSGFRSGRMESRVARRRPAA